MSPGGEITWYCFTPYAVTISFIAVARWSRMRSGSAVPGPPFSLKLGPGGSDDGLIDALAEALVDVWQRLHLPLKASALAAE